MAFGRRWPRHPLLPTGQPFSSKNRFFRPRIILLLLALIVAFRFFGPDCFTAGTGHIGHDPLLAGYLEFIHDAPPQLGSLNLRQKGVDHMRYVSSVTAKTERLDVVSLSSRDLEATKLAHESVVEAIPKFENIISYNNSTRGIVTIGGDTFTAQVLVQLRMLRRFNTDLPVEVFLPKADEAEAKSHICQTLLPALNARCVLLPKVKGYQLSRFSYKAFALLSTSFDDILFLDADNFPIVDPSSFFDTEPYLSTGLVTWPDFWEDMVSPLYYRIISKPVDPMTLHAGSESGQILISKRKHIHTLLLALYYSIFGDRQYFYLFNQGGHGEGDKDFWVHAARVFDLPYYQVREATVELGGPVMEWYYVGIAQAHPGDDYARQLKAPETTTRYTPTARTVLIHHSWTKLNPAFMILQRYDRTWERMWGSKEQTVRKYGFDLEDEIWQEVLWVGCGVVMHLPARDDRNKCRKLQSIWEEILRKDGLSELEIKKKVDAATDVGRKVRLLPTSRS